MPAETMVPILAAMLLATGWALWLLPVGTCAQCSHCRAEQVAKRRETDGDLGRVYSVPLCTACGSYHRPGEGHRR